MGVALIGLGLGIRLLIGLVIILSYTADVCVDHFLKYQVVCGKLPPLRTMFDGRRTSVVEPASVARRGPFPRGVN